MPGVILLSPRQQFFDGKGLPLVDGTVEIYYAGTTTPAPTWQDRFLTVDNDWPVTLDATGSCLMYGDGARTYKRVVRSVLGVVQPQHGADNILVGGEAPTISQRTVDLFSGTGAPATYPLSVTPNSKASTSVHVAGVYVPQASYTLVGNQLTMTAAVGTNNVEVITTDLIDYAGVAATVARAADAATATAHIYPGTFPALPTTRPDGSAIQEGDRAFYSGDNNEYIRRAGVWVNFEHDAAASAAASAGSASASASSASASASSATASANSATTASNASAAAATASATAGAYPSTASANVPRGLTQASVGAITAGSGGTNGTFALAWSGGNFAINPTGTFTVAGGVLTAVTITGPGLYIGAAPTVPTPSFAASSGLAGAAVALTAQFLVTSGQGYWVTSTDGQRLDRYKNVSGVATSDTANVASIPTSAALDDTYHERLFSAQGRWADERRTRGLTRPRPKALVLVALGQSNNANFNTPVSSIVSPNAYQPAGGNAIGFWDFYSVNQQYSVQWDDIGLAPVQWQDVTTENALSGAIAVLDGVFPRIYAFSAAYGGNAILELGGAGKRTNLYAAVHKLCDHARAAGFEPVVAYTSVQGEANMSSFGLLDEATYYTYALSYYRMCQMVAAQAMDLPGFQAPIVFFTPVQAAQGEASRAIKSAIVRVANDITNGILAGGLYVWPVNADLIHGTAVGFRERSEYSGWLLQRFFTRSEVFRGLKAVDAFSVDAVTKVVAFNDEIARDTARVFLNNATTAPAGIEYDDAGSNITISSIAIAGRKATLTLATAPVGASSLQFIRIANQTAPANGTWPGQSSGSQIRSATDPGFLSLYDPTYRQYVWAAPQKIAVR